MSSKDPRVIDIPEDWILIVPDRILDIIKNGFAPLGIKGIDGEDFVYLRVRAKNVKKPPDRERPQYSGSSVPAEIHRSSPHITTRSQDTQDTQDSQYSQNNTQNTDDTMSDDQPLSSSPSDITTLLQYYSQTSSGSSQTSSSQTSQTSSLRTSGLIQRQETLTVPIIRACTNGNNCMRDACTFDHPDGRCRFGSKCTRSNCKRTHIPIAKPAQTKIK